MRGLAERPEEIRELRRVGHLPAHRRRFHLAQALERGAAQAEEEERVGHLRIRGYAEGGEPEAPAAVPVVAFVAGVHWTRAPVRFQNKSGTRLMMSPGESRSASAGWPTASGNRSTSSCQAARRSASSAAARSA